MIEQETKPPIYPPIEKEIRDLRHQLITVAMYRNKDSAKFLNTPLNVSPIIITESPQADGEIITLFGDNHWGIKNKKIYSNEIVPYKIRETWAGIRMPHFTDIMNQYWEYYNANCDAVDNNRISSKRFMEREDELNMWLLNTKREFTEIHNYEILEGLYYDLSLAVQLEML